jgi:hypothetical protein
MPIMRNFKPKRHLAIAVVVCSQIMSACGGGSETTSEITTAPSPVGNPPVSSAPVASKIDLKTVDGSQKAIAVATSSLDFVSFSNQAGAKESIYTTAGPLNSVFPCELSGTNTFSTTNSDRVLSPGDQYVFLATNCRSKGNEGSGFSETNGPITYTIEAIEGNPLDPSGSLTTTTRSTAQRQNISDETINGIRYLSRGTGTSNGTYIASHDGKATSIDTDDTDRFSGTLTLNFNGTVNDTPVSLNAATSWTDCLSTRLGSSAAKTICASVGLTSSGSSLSIGDFNFKLTSLTAIEYNASQVPVSGEIRFIQGSETISAKFSLNSNGQPIVTITSSSGAVSTLLLSELSKLRDSLQ